MLSQSLKFRCFHVGGGHELVLPGGKTILIDPYYPDRNHPQEDIQGADYILLTHSHFDHDLNLGWIAKKFDSRIIMPAGAALAEAKYQRLAYDSIFPAYPNSRFTFPDFTLDVFLAKHNTLGKAAYDPEVDVTFKMTGVKGDLDTDALGGIFSNDYLITTSNGFRILIASGQIEWAEALSQFQAMRPNLLLRQCSVRPRGADMYQGSQVSAKELAKLFTSYNAQILVPFHMDSLLKRWDEAQLESYFREVADEVRKADPGAVFVVPEAWKWYQIGIDVSLAE